MLKAKSRLAHISSSLLLPAVSHSRRRRLTISTMNSLTIKSKYSLLSGHEIPVLGFGVRLLFPFLSWHALHSLPLSLAVF